MSYKKIGTIILAVLFGAFRINIATVAAASYSASFSSISDYISIPDNSALDITSSFTVEAWFKITTLPTAGQVATIMGKGTNGDGNSAEQHSFFLLLTNANFGLAGAGIAAGFEHTTGANHQVTYSVTHTSGQWYHLALVFDNTADTLTLYQNGVQVAQSTSITATPPANSTAVTLGKLSADATAANEVTIGQVDDVRIWNTARTSANISDNFTAELTGSETGLVGYWKLNEGTGTTADDASSTGNDGTLTGSASWSTSHPFYQRKGLTFSSGSDYVSVPDHANLDISSSFTVEAWFNPSTLPGSTEADGFVGKGVSGDSNATEQHTLFLAITNGGLGTSGRNLVAAFENSAGTNQQVAYTYTHTVGQWYHAALVFDDSTNTLTLYQDGVQVAQTTGITEVPLPNAQILTIGRLSSDVTTSNFEGSVDDVRIWNTARTSTEIASSYATELSGSETGLVGYWKLNEGASTTADDASSTGNDGTVTGSITRLNVPTLTYGPVVGAVGTSSVKIWGKTERDAQYEVAYKPSSSSTYSTSTGPITKYASDNTASVSITGLSPSTTYDYSIFVNDAEQPETGSFTTLPEDNEPGSFSFAFGADLNYTFVPHSIMAKVDTKNPLFTLIIGDIMYADAPSSISTLSEYRAKYKDNWNDASLKSFFKGNPSFMMWDDHEITNDWDALKTGLYTNARQAFDEYVSTTTPTARTSGELYYSFDVGETSFYILDTRTFRSTNSSTDNSSKSMLGAVQKADLKNWLLTSPAKFKFIISSVPVSDFGTTNNDSWYGFQTERAEIFNYIDSNAIEGVILVSGDQHWSMVAKLDDIAPDYYLYEFMPTPFHAILRTETASNDAQILFKQDDDYNYGFFTVNTSVSPATVAFINYSSTNSSLYSLTVSETDINANTAPRLTIEEAVPSSDTTGDWVISYTLVDADSDSVTLDASYSTDGSSWSTATLSSNSAGTPGGKTLTWQTASDLTGSNATVYFRVRGNDGTGYGSYRYIGDTLTSPGTAFSVSNTTSSATPAQTLSGSHRRSISSLTTTPSAPTVPVTLFVPFTRNLRFGNEGEDVKRLQIFLNKDNFIVSKSGPGSPGNETNYFGLATLNALMRFQRYYKIDPPKGFLGPITREKMREIELNTLQ